MNIPRDQAFYVARGALFARTQRPFGPSAQGGCSGPADGFPLEPAGL